jgi:hypothetical protein
MKFKFFSLIGAVALVLALNPMAKADTACPSGFTGTGQSAGCMIDLAVTNESHPVVFTAP